MAARPFFADHVEALRHVEITPLATRDRPYSCRHGAREHVYKFVLSFGIPREIGIDDAKGSLAI